MRTLSFVLGTLLLASACSSSSTGSSGASGPSPGCADAPDGDRPRATETVAAEKCTLPPTTGGVSARLTSAGGKTHLYLSVQERINAGPTEMRRYTLRDGAGCAFERDADFTAPAPVINFAVDDAGTLYSGEGSAVVRVRDGERVTCASSFEGGFGVSQDFFAVARDGSFGIVNVGNVRSVAKVTATNDGCTLGRLALTQPLLQPGVVAIDSKKRFHIAALAVGEDDLTPRIAVVDAEGGVACAYHSTRKSSERRHEAIVPCGGGMCIDGGDEIVRVTEDGVFARAVRVTSPLANAQLVGASEAPYPLLVGSVGATDEVAVFAVRGL